ncbi:MAG: hypothetical protein JWP22_3022 [Ramlibacter sp.]|jgi:hypothetical protein|nr:hypothetical protein [Ramlibacter sp.]MDB5914347.1 hypothetical protein [Ramlibacter sp.]
MPSQTNPADPARNEGTSREDGPTPAASEESVLEETVRLAREGRKELEADPKEPKPASQ